MSRVAACLVLFGLFVPGVRPGYGSAPPPRPGPAGKAYDPDEAYAEQRIRGWLVRVNKKLLAKEHEQVCKQTLELLDDHLYRVTRVVPAAALEKVRKVPIWVEYAHPKHPCMVYHPSREWLRDHQMNPNKAGAVEISNVRNFLAWTHQQPWMVLHELAHGYHHQVLGFENADINLCHQEAMRNKLYDSVLHVTGNKTRHYACTNPKEYFAEMTESYFGTNDFYPFVRAELKAIDPRMHALVEKVWGVKKR